jgi:hypothetical protein
VPHGVGEQLVDGGHPVLGLPCPEADLGGELLHPLADDRDLDAGELGDVKGPGSRRR